MEGAEYVETGSWRTADHDKSVVAVGEALKKELEEYGYSVLHDTTNHEPPKLSSAYTRSLETMEKYAKEYPTLKVFIDVHRDAYDIEKGKSDYVTVEGGPVRKGHVCRRHRRGQNRPGLRGKTEL